MRVWGQTPVGTEAAPHVRGSGRVKPTVAEGLGAKPQRGVDAAPHVRGSGRVKPLHLKAF